MKISKIKSTLNGKWDIGKGGYFMQHGWVDYKFESQFKFNKNQGLICNFKKFWGHL